ncbi:MAG: imidazole glycerol phosphate synthase subunit HisF [Proteobacteria bacterium]|nr:imidazole glycerol phosphate synthase subunit HisF [Pseudomonadota bacterium]
MLSARILPCLDVRADRVVKGVSFQSLRDAGSPTELASEYERQSADELVMLDVSATPDERRTALHTVEAIRDRLGIPLTVGGGVRSVADANNLLEAGADKVSVNTAAVADPPLVDELARRFGSQCTVVAVDAARTQSGRFQAVVRSGSERVALDVVDWAREVAERGAGEILLTSWDRDGTRQGYDCALLRAVSAAVAIPVIASGGASHAEHLLQAFRAGASAALAASIFHYKDTTVGAVKEYLAAHGIEVRR